MSLSRIFPLKHTGIAHQVILLSLPHNFPQQIADSHGAQNPGDCLLLYVQDASMVLGERKVQ